MANSTPNNNSLFNWALVIAVAFLVGKTCNCGNNEKAEERYDDAPVYHVVQRDTAQVAMDNSTDSKPAPTRQRVYRSRASAANRYLIRGPRGGCYYINSSGNKVYVDRSLCN
jgi:hypothetical protein